MAPSPCEKAIPELRAPWSGLNATIRCCWTSAHPRLEIRAVTISGAQVLDKPMMITSGDEIPIHEAFVPFGCGVSWSVIVFVGDVTGTAMDGLTIVAELKDAEGRGVRQVIGAGKKAAANKAVQIKGLVTAPERDHE